MQSIIFKLFDMTIPKVIYQTYASSKIPLYARFQIWNFRRRHQDYDYVFYDDQMIDAFIKDNFNDSVYQVFSRIQIGVAKADFFRYAILYKKGGIYLDLDSTIVSSLNKVLDSGCSALIATEKTNKKLYAQWALVYEKGHPILRETLKIILTNISKNRYVHDIHMLTGPTPYSVAVYRYLEENIQDHNIKVAETNYKGIFKYKTVLARLYELFNKRKHWRQLQKRQPVYK